MCNCKYIIEKYLYLTDLLTYYKCLCQNKQNCNCIKLKIENLENQIKTLEKIINKLPCCNNGNNGNNGNDK